MQAVIGGLTAVVALFGTLCLTPAALGGPPGKWTRITGLQGVEAVNTDELGLERTADGVLHVAWPRTGSGSSDLLLHSAIAADAGSVSGPDPIITGPNNGLNPSVELLPGPDGGMRVLFAGLFPGAPIDQVMSSATAPAAGTPFSAAVPVSSNEIGTAHAVYVASGIGGAVSPAGVTAFAWGDSGPSEGGYHLGLDPTAPDMPFSDALEVNPNVAFDTITGAGFVAWNLLGTDTGANSLSARPLGIGAALTAPGSGAVGLGDRVSISGRIGADGIYAAYGHGSNQFLGRLAIWRVGAPKARVVKQSRGAQHIGLAPAPTGRLWTWWQRRGRLFASRSNGSVTNLGTPVSPQLPKGAQTVYRIQGEGSRGPLDLLVLTDAKGGLGFFHQRVLPGLGLVAKPKAVKAGKASTFRVTDAGAPVKGAKVKLKIGQKKLVKKTNAKGKASFKIPGATKSGRYAATATKGGYTRAIARLRVKK